MKKVFSRKKLLFCIIVVLLLKISICYVEDMKYILERYIYKTQVNVFESAKMEDVDELLKRKKLLVYMGRAGCGDCKKSLKNILRLGKEAEARDVKVYYIEIPEGLNKTEKNFLESKLKVDCIPVIIKKDGGSYVKFTFEDINAEDCMKKFNNFLERR